MLGLANPANLPLAEAFQPEYEKRSRKLVVEAYPEPATVRLDAAAAKRLVEQEWRAQRGDQTLQDAVADELIRCERILNRQGQPADAPERIQLAKWKRSPADALLYTDVRRLKRGLLVGEVMFPTQDTVVPPMTAMSYRSPLVEIVSSGKHHEVKVSPAEEAMIIAWIDTLCPYMGTEEILQQPDIDPKQYYSDPINNKFTYPPRMRTMPAVHRAFQQDNFQTQDDRLPRDADGKVLPSIYYEGNRRNFTKNHP